MSRSTATLGARVGAHLRHHGASSRQYLDAKRDHAAAAIADAAARYLADAPKLTDEQVERIADILRGAPTTEVER